MPRRHRENSVLSNICNERSTRRRAGSSRDCRARTKRARRERKSRRAIEPAQGRIGKGWNEGNTISPRKRAHRRNEGKGGAPRNSRDDVVPKMELSALLKREGSEGRRGGWALNSSTRSESWPKVDFLFSSSGARLGVELAEFRSDDVRFASAPAVLNLRGVAVKAEFRAGSPVPRRGRRLLPAGPGGTPFSQFRLITVQTRS